MCVREEGSKGEKRKKGRKRNRGREGREWTKSLPPLYARTCERESEGMNIPLLAFTCIHACKGGRENMDETEDVSGGRT